MGGLAKVPKGFSMMTKEKRKKVARAAALARWGGKKLEKKPGKAA